MKHRNLAAVIIFTLITLGIYGLVWLVMTTREMRTRGANIPNCILIIIPLINYYWYWRYSEGVQKVTGGKWAAALIFLLFIFTGIGGIIMSQLAFNEDTAAAAAGATTFPGKATPHTPEAAVQGVGVGAGVGAATEAVKDSPQVSAEPDNNSQTETKAPPEDTNPAEPESPENDTSSDQPANQTTATESEAPANSPAGEPAEEPDTNTEEDSPIEPDNNLPHL